MADLYLSGVRKISWRLANHPERFEKDTPTVACVRTTLQNLFENSQLKDLVLHGNQGVDVTVTAAPGTNIWASPGRATDSLTVLHGSYSAPLPPRQLVLVVEKEADYSPVIGKFWLSGSQPPWQDCLLWWMQEQREAGVDPIADRGSALSLEPTEEGYLLKAPRPDDRGDVLEFVIVDLSAVREVLS